MGADGKGGLASPVVAEASGSRPASPGVSLSHPASLNDLFSSLQDSATKKSAQTILGAGAFEAAAAVEGEQSQAAAAAGQSAGGQSADGTCLVEPVVAASMGAAATAKALMMELEGNKKMCKMRAAARRRSVGVWVAAAALLLLLACGAGLVAVQQGMIDARAPRACSGAYQQYFTDADAMGASQPAAWRIAALQARWMVCDWVDYVTQPGDAAGDAKSGTAANSAGVTKTVTKTKPPTPVATQAAPALVKPKISTATNAQPVAVKPAVVKPPAAAKPAVQLPIVKPPVLVNKPVAKLPIAKKPIVKPPVLVNKPIAKLPIAKQTAAAQQQLQPPKKLKMELAALVRPMVTALSSSASALRTHSVWTAIKSGGHAQKPELQASSKPAIKGVQQSAVQKQSKGVRSALVMAIAGVVAVIALAAVAVFAAPGLLGAAGSAAVAAAARVATPKSKVGAFLCCVYRDSVGLLNFECGRSSRSLITTCNHHHRHPSHRPPVHPAKQPPPSPPTWTKTKTNPSRTCPHPVQPERAAQPPPPLLPRRGRPAAAARRRRCRRC